MKTNRIFIGDIYIGNKIIKRDAVLIFYPGRGYIDYDMIMGTFVNIRVFFGKLDELFMGTTIDLNKKYVNRETLRQFDYDNISSLSEISDLELKIIVDKFQSKKSNL